MSNSTSCFLKIGYIWSLDALAEGNALGLSKSFSYNYECCTFCDSVESNAKS